MQSFTIEYKVETKDKYIIPLKDLKESSTRYEFKLTDEFFEMVDGPEIRKGNLDAIVEVHKHESSFTLDFDIKGVVTVTCDRCLDDMDQEIETEEHLKVKYGEKFEEVSDTLVVVPESEGTIDISWYLYEFAALNIPMRHVHPEGQCNQEMADKLADVLISTVDEGEAKASDKKEQPIDPRWEVLKNLKLKD